MKNTIVLMAAAILAVGCDQQRQANNNTSTSPEKDQIRQSARDAKSEVDKQARAEKEMLDKEAKAAQAKIDAETARAKAAATDAQSKVDTASQNIRDAAGAGSAKAQSEVGAGTSTAPATPPPAEQAAPVTANPATSANAAGDADQKLADQVRTALNGGTAEATADASKNVQVSASSGTVTLKGTVTSDAQKTQIETAAKAVSGVSKVVNQLEVKTGE